MTHPKIRKAGTNKKLKALIHGPPGQGKTHLLGTANDDPRTAPILVLDFEGGETTLANSGVDVWQIRNWQDYDEAFAYIAKGDHPYKTIAVDSLSETHTSALFQILENEADKRKDPDVLQIQDYGKAGLQLRRLVREFRDLPYHVIFTAHSKDDKDPKEGTVKVPALSGQVSSDVAGMVDVVGYLALATDKDGNVERALLLHGYAKFRTKARAAWGKEVPTEIEDPSITSLLDALGFEHEEEVKEKQTAAEEQKRKK